MNLVEVNMKHRNKKACKTSEKIKKTNSNERDLKNVDNERGQKLDDKKKHIRTDENDDDRKNDFIRLNVGGVIFITTLTTLKSCPESSLSKMFSSDNSSYSGMLKDESGAFLIDSSPTMFGYVLDWCRYKQLILKENTVDLNSLEAVADYFCLDDMLAAVKKRKEMAGAERKRKKIRSSALEKNMKEINESLNLISRTHCYELVMAVEDIQSELKTYREQMHKDQIHIVMPYNNT